MKRLTLLPILSALVGLGYPHASHAASTPSDEAEITLSLGAERTNRNIVGEVSDKPTWSPTFGVNYQKGRFFAGTDRGIGYNLVQEGGFQAFVAASADPGRKDGDRKNSPRLVGMGKIDGTALAVAGVVYQAFDGLIKLNASQMMSAKRSYGSQTVINATLAVPIWGDKLGASLSLGATHADRKQAQTFYGVTPAQTARTGNRVYNAKAGWISCDASLGLSYQIDKNWSTSASIGRHELREAAALSPLFATKKSNVGSASISYRF
ncbi:MAG: MipA/OmpV family protein [Betaproteobacteria bacterium]|nr:MAG: MipA/OmpV family protein [Betaproteobacteria bacterium]